jgi:hypothetical protein
VHVAERSSLVQLKAFLRRCIDVISFLEHIEKEVDNQKRNFSHLMRQLGPELQNRLSKEEFRDFVVYESNEMVRKMLEKTIQMEATEDAKLSEQTLRMKQNRVSQLCPTLFSPVESRVFLGLSMIQTSCIETDIMRKDELVKKAIDNLIVDTTKFEMDSVVPELAKNK